MQLFCFVFSFCRLPRVRISNFSSNDNPEIRASPIHREVLSVVSFSEPDNFKLLRVIFVKESDRNADVAHVVGRDVFRLIDVDSIKIVVVRVLRFIADAGSGEREFFVPLLVIQVG